MSTRVRRPRASCSAARLGFRHRPLRRRLRPPAVPPPPWCRPPRRSTTRERGPAAEPALGAPPPLQGHGRARPSRRAAAPPLALYPALSTQHRLALPSRRALLAARRFAAAREGRVSFAVLGPGGRIIGPGTDTTYESASLVKAMILVAYLRKVAAEEREPTELELLRMGDMIRVSDNFSATTLWTRWARGARRARRRGRNAGLRPRIFWGNCIVTAGRPGALLPRAGPPAPGRPPRLRARPARERGLVPQLGDSRGRPPGLARLLQGRLAAG